MAAAGLPEPLVAFWKEWGILVLVLMSFAQQLILLISAEIRRHKDSGVLKVVVWSAYLLADTTAIYALGHMSVTSTTSQEHQLMAFWAPFLLLHLGGQDNITAYSIEDNRLWLRHLQSFVVQALAASYVLYQSSILARRTLLRPAAILMFVVGVLKYGERVCALKRACVSNLSGQNYQSFHKYPIHDSGPDASNAISSNSYIYDLYEGYGRNGQSFHKYPMEEESQTFRAHVLLDFPKNLLKGPLPVVAFDKHIRSEWEEMYGVAEMQLSLMHDVFYSKAELIHTWYGYCIRVVSLPATVAALLMFHRFSEKDGYRGADVATTYVLLAGAVILETTSVLRAMFSTWTYYKLRTGSKSRVVRALARLVFLPLRLRRGLSRYAMCRGEVRATARYWSGSIGQHNFIYMCTRCKDSRGTKIARWMGREDWWNMLVYTSSIPVSADISELLKKQMKASQNVDNESPDHIQNSRGRAALKRRPGLYEELGWLVDTEPDESILVWHIATHVYLSWYEDAGGGPHHLAQVTQELSNYMIFLLAARPYMLPHNTSRQRYVELCDEVIHRLEYSSEADLVKLIQDHAVALSGGQTAGAAHRLGRNVTFDSACHLGAKLISKELETPDANMLELISQVWVELLCYTAYRCFFVLHGVSV